MNIRPAPVLLLPGDYIALVVREPRTPPDPGVEPDDPEHQDIYRRPCFTQGDYERRKRWEYSKTSLQD